MAQRPLDRVVPDFGRETRAGSAHTRLSSLEITSAFEYRFHFGNTMLAEGFSSIVIDMENSHETHCSYSRCLCRTVRTGHR